MINYYNTPFPAIAKRCDARRITQTQLYQMSGGKVLENTEYRAGAVNINFELRIIQ